MCVFSLILYSYYQIKGKYIQKIKTHVAEIIPPQLADGS